MDIFPLRGKTRPRQFKTGLLIRRGSNRVGSLRAFFAGSSVVSDDHAKATGQSQKTKPEIEAENRSQDLTRTAANTPKRSAPTDTSDSTPRLSIHRIFNSKKTAQLEPISRFAPHTLPGRASFNKLCPSFIDEACSPAQLQFSGRPLGAQTSRQIEASTAPTANSAAGPLCLRGAAASA